MSTIDVTVTGPGLVNQVGPGIDQVGPGIEVYAGDSRTRNPTRRGEAHGRTAVYVCGPGRSVPKP